MSIAIFLAFVAFVLGLSWFLGRRAKTSAGYFAAHGQVGWFVNGIAFAGDYLSAASFLGICGMIAFYGYDGFLYSIGFLAGWVVALFVIAEPIKRLGKFTFADALAAKFDNSRGITLAAAISTLVVSVFYLIPQMVGAGSLIKPLLGFPHWVGVILVGGIVITIVTTAGMVSTTWVQFIKGSLLVVFCAVLVVMILNRGLTKNLTEDRSGWIDAPIADYLAARRLTPLNTIQQKSSEPIYFSGPNADGKESIFRIQDASHGFQINEAQIVPDGSDKQLRPSGMIERLEGDATATGSVGPRWFLVQLSRATIINAVSEKLVLTDGTSATGYYQQDRQGEQLLLPGGYFKGIRSPNLLDRLDFASLMLALFCGTAALPHILIRYYTVKDASAARKSTVVGICAIGFFYILTLYIGLGAMVSGNLDPTDSNMSAPLLAKTFGELPFAIISAIAFTTVLGTVSGLILAAAGAVAHDLVNCFWSPLPPAGGGGDRRERLTDRQQVGVAKIAAVVVGLVAIGLGILFKGFNTTFLVGWAFNIAASANLPAIVMLLFWRGTTRQGVVAGILLGLITSLTWLAFTKEAMVNLYGIPGATGLVPMSQPALVTVPLSFAVVIVVSLLTPRGEDRRGFEVSRAGG